MLYCFSQMRLLVLSTNTLTQSLIHALLIINIEDDGDKAFINTGLNEDDVQYYSSPCYILLGMLDSREI